MPDSPFPINQEAKTNYTECDWLFLFIVAFILATELAERILNFQKDKSLHWSQWNFVIGFCVAITSPPELYSLFSWLPHSFFFTRSFYRFAKVLLIVPLTRRWLQEEPGSLLQGAGALQAVRTPVRFICTMWKESPWGWWCWSWGKPRLVFAKPPPLCFEVLRKAFLGHQCCIWLQAWGVSGRGPGIP